MAQRQYESATIFANRIVDMRHLWTPSTEYKGQQTQKPNYFASFITPKTQAHWSSEPAFAGVMAAFGKLLQGQLQTFANMPHAVDWPISDGDMPNKEGKSSDWAKGHWVYSASTGNPPTVELAQPNGTLIKLSNKVGVKSGDNTMVGLTAAVKQNDARGVKFYLNAVVFTSPGEEIVFANSVSGAELMRMAQQQGLQVAGFTGSPAGFGTPPAAPGGFGAPPQGAPGGFGGGAQPNFGGAPAPAFAAPQPGGFQPQGAPGFWQGQPPAGGAGPGMPQFAAPANSPAGGAQTWNNGQSAPPNASPSNAVPGGFGAPPANPFAPR